MKFNNLTTIASVNSDSNKNESKEDFDYQSVINYPADNGKGKTTEHVITLLEYDDFDLSPLRMRDNGDGTELNPDCSMKVVHSLPTKVNGCGVVVSNKRLIPYTATKDQIDKDGVVYLKAGAKSAYYDKDVVRECEFEKAMKLWKKASMTMEGFKKSKAENTYRRSNMLYVKCFLWQTVITDETGESTVVDVNKPVIMGFDVKDLFFAGRLAYGDKIIKAFSSRKGNLFAKNKFLFTAKDLSTEEVLNSDEQKMIDGLRAEVKAGALGEQFNKLYPIPYDTFMALVKSGEATIELPSADKTQVQASKTITTKVSKDEFDKVLKEEKVTKLVEDFDSDEMPF